MRSRSSGRSSAGVRCFPRSSTGLRRCLARSSERSSAGARSFPRSSTGLGRCLVRSSGKGSAGARCLPLSSAAAWRCFERLRSPSSWMGAASASCLPVSSDRWGSSFGGRSAGWWSVLVTVFHSFMGGSHSVVVAAHSVMVAAVVAVVAVVAVAVVGVGVAAVAAAVEIRMPETARRGLGAGLRASLNWRISDSCPGNGNRQLRTQNSWALGTKGHGICTLCHAGGHMLFTSRGARVLDAFRGSRDMFAGLLFMSVDIVVESIL